MDRYFIYVEGETQECDLEVVQNPNGEWVKYSDAQAEIDRLEAHVRAINSSMDHHAATAATRLSTKISEIDKLQARVMELEGEVSQLSEEVNNARETMNGEIRYNADLRNRVRELEAMVKGMIPMPKVEVEQDDTLGTIVRMNDVWIWHDAKSGVLQLDSARNYTNRVINALKGTP